MIVEVRFITLGFRTSLLAVTVEMAQDEQSKDSGSKKKVSTKDKEKTKSKEKAPSKVIE